MPKRVLQGTVVSDKGNKTVVVKVERAYLHPLFKKTIRRTKKYHAHDEKNAHKVGDNSSGGKLSPVNPGTTPSLGRVA